jgi:hypothetical protein
MRAKYNTYTLPEGRWSISKVMHSNENTARQEMTVTHKVDIDGHLSGANAAAIEAQYTLLTAAYATNGFDFIVFLPSGRISDRLSLLSRGSLAGVRVMQKPSIQSLEHGQYALYLPVKISLEAEYISGTSAMLTAFEETLDFEGGGPLFDWYRPIRGLPSKGFVRQADTYRATQSGKAVGFGDYPSLGTISGAPGPIFGIELLNRNPKVSRGSPEKRGLVYINWPISWTYEFESSSPLFGSPNRWPFQ